VRRRIVEILGHVDDVGADHLSMLIEVGMGHVERVEHDRRGLLVEPVVERAREGRRWPATGEQQGGQCAMAAKEDDNARVQAGTGDLFLHGAPKAHGVHR
jgi:hypothetical protein